MKDDLLYGSVLREFTEGRFRRDLAAAAEGESTAAKKPPIYIQIETKLDDLESSRMTPTEFLKFLIHIAKKYPEEVMGFPPNYKEDVLQGKASPPDWWAPTKVILYSFYQRDEIRKCESNVHLGRRLFYGILKSDGTILEVIPLNPTEDDAREYYDTPTESIKSPRYPESKYDYLVSLAKDMQKSTVEFAASEFVRNKQRAAEKNFADLMGPWPVLSGWSLPIGLVDKLVQESDEEGLHRSHAPQKSTVSVTSCQETWDSYRKLDSSAGKVISGQLMSPLAHDEKTGVILALVGAAKLAEILKAQYKWRLNPVSDIPDWLPPRQPREERELYSLIRMHKNEVNRTPATLALLKFSPRGFELIESFKPGPKSRAALPGEQLPLPEILVRFRSEFRRFLLPKVGSAWDKHVFSAVDFPAAMAAFKEEVEKTRTSPVR